MLTSAVTLTLQASFPSLSFSKLHLLVSLITSHFPQFAPHFFNLSSQSSCTLPHHNLVSTLFSFCTHWPNTRPSLVRPAPPFPSLPPPCHLLRNATTTGYDSTYYVCVSPRPDPPSRGQTPSPPYPSLPLRNATTKDYDITYYVCVNLTDSGEPTSVIIKKGADVALTVATSDATWINSTLSDFELAEPGSKQNPKGNRGKQSPPLPSFPLGYNHELLGTWLSASTLMADNGQTYKELADAMLAAPDASYSALVYTKTYEAGAANGGFLVFPTGGREGSSTLAIKASLLDAEHPHPCVSQHPHPCVSPQQRREWAVRLGATTGGTCESTPVGSAASRRRGYGGGQQQQQRSLETLSLQQLREWAVRCGSFGGGGFRGTHTGGEESTSLGACDSASAGAEPEEALHTFTLDSGASRCFFHDNTTVTPLTALVLVTLADPSGGLVVARGATVLPCPAAPSGLLTGLHLPSFAKNMVATSVLQDQWVTVTQPGGELVVICTDSHTGEHLTTFTRRHGSVLYTLTTESALVAESGQVAVSVEVAASCSCRLLTHQTLLWHHRLGHPSLPRLRGMHSRLLVSGLPRSLPPLPRSLAPPCLPCVEGRQRVAPHSSSFRPTTAPLQTLHMDVWGPARVTGQSGERYFLLVVDDYTRYTTVFPWQSKADVRGDLPVLRLHSDQGGEFCSHLLEDFCVMEVARTSMIHADATHFLWPFAVRYAAEQLNLWPRVSHQETYPTLRWTGEVGDASAFWVWGSLSLVRDLPAGKLSPHTLRCVFLGFPTDALPWQFYHPGSPLSPLSLVDNPPPVAPLPPPGPAPSGVSQVDPPPLVETLEVSSDTSGPVEGGDQTTTDTVVPRRSAHLAVPPGFQPRPSSPPLRPVAVDYGAAGGGDTGGADSGGADSGGAASPTGAGGAGGAAAGGSAGGGAGGSGGADPGGASAGVPGVGTAGGTGATGGTGGAAAVGAAAGGPGSRRQEPLSPERLCEWAVRWGSPGGGAGRTGAARSGGVGPGGASAGVLGTGGTGAAGGTGGAGAAGGTRSAGPGGASAGVPGVGRAGGIGTGGGADTGGTTRGTGVSGASRQESLSPLQLREWAVCWGSPGGGAGGNGSGGVVATGAGGSGGATTQPQPSALRHLLSLPPAATEFPVAGTTPPLLFPLMKACESRERSHDMTLHPSSVPQSVVLPPPPTSSLPHVPNPESDLVRGASPTVTRLLATVVTDPSFESAAASALVAELVDFAALCRLDYSASLFELECLAAAAPHLASTLRTDSDALDIPTPRTYAEAITGTYVDEVPPPGANIVNGMGIFRVKRPPGSPPAFKARYVARGFSQHTSLPPFYVLVYVDDLVFAIADTEALALVKAELQERHTCSDLGELRSYLGLQCYIGYFVSFSASTSCGPRHSPLLCLPATRSKLHLWMSPTSDMGLVLGGPSLVVLTDHSDASWADDQTTHQSMQGYSFSLGIGSVSWRSTRSSSVLSFSCEAKIYVGAMAAQELRWLTYLLTDLGERPRSPPVLYVDKKAMIALFQDQRLEHRTKPIAFRYFLTRELQQRGQLCLAYVATQANTVDAFTKALGSSDHQRFCCALGLVPTLPHLLIS
ncbi:unnamed protein product [Closterium sp. NIES-53]